MTSSTTLNLANYATVWQDNFANDSQLNWNQFPIAWGYGNDFVFANGALTLTSYASQGWAAAGFMQADLGATSGQGYGLYSVKASANAGEGVGICAVMWPADNNWPGPEIDLLEDWSDPSRQTGYSTIHWKGANDSNGQDIHQFHVDLTKPHVFAMDWEPGKLTYYIDNQEIYQVTGAEVPKDAADGGVNESFGAEVTAAGYNPVSSSVSLHLYDMSYAKYTGGGGGPSPTITVSSPGTVQEASKGAGVTVTETVSDPGLTKVYYQVRTASGAAETGWTAKALSSAGSASFGVHFAHSGDYLVVVNDPNGPVDTGQSAAITITDPKGPSIALSKPGTVQEVRPGAGVTVTETASAAGLSSIYYQVRTSAGAAETAWKALTLNSTGTGSFSAHFAHTGDYVYAVNNTTSPTVKASSAAITITDPGTGGPGNITLTGDALTAKSTAWTVIGTLSSTDSHPVTWAMGSNPGGLFSVDSNKLLINQNMPAGAASSYKVGIIAVDSTGAVGSADLTVGVKSAAAAAVTASSLISTDTVTTAAKQFSFAPKFDQSVSAAANETFTYHVADGLDTIKKFSPAAGDVLNIDQSLQSSMHETVSAGSSILTFGDPHHGIHLQGVPHFDTAQIHWV
jgi:hypothetical protein